MTTPTYVRAIEEIRAQALEAARQRVANRAAVVERSDAEIEVLRAMVDAVGPSLAALSAPLVERRSRHGCAAHDVAAGQNINSRVRGLLVLPSVALAENGTWYRDNAPEGAGDGHCHWWDWRPIDARSLLSVVPLHDLMLGMDDAIAQQVGGKLSDATRQIQADASRLRAVITLIGGAR